MELKEERLQWKHDSARTEQYVDAIIKMLVENADAAPAAYMAVDMCFRPYLQWVHSCQIRKEDPSLVFAAAVHLVNMMILEMMARMTPPVPDEGPAIKWLEEFLETLKEEVMIDVKQLVENRKNKQQ